MLANATETREDDRGGGIEDTLFSLHLRLTWPSRLQVSNNKKANPTLSPGGLIKQSSHPCWSCSMCCTYVATQIDEPTTMADYDHIVWYLYHEGISVYIDWEGDWYLQMETRCVNLTPAGLCGIYEHRPAICKDFDWRDCERQRGPELKPPERHLFRDVEEFYGWFGKRRPRTHERYRQFLARKHAAANDPELGRLE